MTGLGSSFCWLVVSIFGAGCGDGGCGDGDGDGDGDIVGIGRGSFGGVKVLIGRGGMGSVFFDVQRLAGNDRFFFTVFRVTTISVFCCWFITGTGGTGGIGSDFFEKKEGLTNDRVLFRGPGATTLPFGCSFDDRSVEEEGRGGVSDDRMSSEAFEISTFPMFREERFGTDLLKKRFPNIDCLFGTLTGLMRSAFDCSLGPNVL